MNRLVFIVLPFSQQNSTHVTSTFLGSGQCDSSSIAALISGNTIQSNAGAGIQIRPTVSSSQTCSPTRSSNVSSLIESNRIIANQVGIDVLVVRPTTSPFSANRSICSAVIRNNLIVSNSSFGVRLDASAIADLSAKLINNTIAYNGGSGISHGEDVDAGFTLQNNLLAGNNRGIAVDTAGFMPTNALVVFNLTFANTNGNWFNYPAEYGNLTTVNINGIPADMHKNISADPLFKGAEGFHLSLFSPCINAGSTTNSPVMDFEGALRILEPDIGYDESRPPQLLETPVFSPITGFSGTLKLEPGYNYRVEVSDDFQIWQVLTTGVSTDGDINFSDAAAAAFGRRFYRVVVVP